MENIPLGDVTLACAIDGDGPLVILQHGFPDDVSTFAGQVPALVAAGFRVVRPTLRGYAPSGRATSGAHDAASAGRDLLALADHFSPRRPVRLVGHDWGAIASFFAVGAAPDRVERFVSMAVPHPTAFLRALASIAQIRRSWYMFRFQAPGAAEALAADDLALVDRLWRDWSPGFHATAEDLARVKAGLRGRADAAIAYYRAMVSPAALVRAAPMFRRVSIPSLHLHGDRDGCIGVEAALGAEHHYSGPYALRRLEDVGHFLTRERPDLVASILVAFLTNGET